MMFKWLIYATLFGFPTVFSQDTTKIELSEEVGNTPCENGWLHFGQKCYRRDSILKSWNDAAYSCTTYGGHLVSIHSEEELGFLVNNILLNYKYAMWIGLHERAKQSEFTWIDGSDVNYTNWMPGEPSKGREDCVQMLYNHPVIKDDVMGKWNDAECHLNYTYICQRKIELPDIENENLPNSTSELPGIENENLPNSTSELPDIENENLPNSTSVFSQDTTKIKQPEEVGNLTCEEGWLHFGQKCYRQTSLIKSWNDADYSCTTYGGHLVSIHSKEELDFLVTHILMNSKYALWIGLHNPDEDSEYSWIDGSDVNYTNWMSGEPSSGNEHCAQMLYNHPAREDDVMGKWNDAKCDLTYWYICQKKIELPGPENENSSNSTSELPGIGNENLPTSTSVFSQHTTKIARSEVVGNTLCEKGWLHFGQKCYRRDSILRSWIDAGYNCGIYGGHLVTIHSKEELGFLVNNILLNYKYAMWIGLHDQDKELEFRWIDGSALNYTNWMSGEPSKGDEYCVQMLYNHPVREDDVMGKWNDANCELKYSYICQKKIVPAEKENEDIPKSLPGKSSVITLTIIVLSVIVLILGIAICYFRWWKNFSFRRSAEGSLYWPNPNITAGNSLESQLPSNHYVMYRTHKDRTTIPSEYHIYESVIHLSAAETEEHYLNMK